MRKTATRIIAGAMIAAGAIAFTGITPASAAPVASMSTSGNAVDGVVDLVNQVCDAAYDLTQGAGDLVDDLLDEVLG